MPPDDEELREHFTEQFLFLVPPTSSSGPVPAQVAAVASESFAEPGLPGLVVAGAGKTAAADAAWSVARGWASLERAEALDPRHRFPAYSITKLITATAVLRLVAEGKVGLDDPANQHLRTVRLAAVLAWPDRSSSSSRPAVRA